MLSAFDYDATGQTVKGSSKDISMKKGDILVLKNSFNGTSGKFLLYYQFFI